MEPPQFFSLPNPLLLRFPASAMPPTPPLLDTVHPLPHLTPQRKPPKRPIPWLNSTLQISNSERFTMPLPFLKSSGLKIWGSFHQVKAGKPWKKGRLIFEEGFQSITQGA